MKGAVPRAPTGRLSLATVLPFSAPSLVLGAMSVAVFVYLPPYFTGHLGVPLAVVGGVWMGIRLLDIPIDLLLAVGMDRTRTPIGRYRPWLLLGAPILMLAFYKLFMAPAHFAAAYLIAWLLVMYLGQSIMSLSHSAWAANLATRYHERSRLFGMLTAVGVVGVMAVLAIEIFGRDAAQGVQSMGWCMIGAIPLTVALAAWRTPERLTPVQGAQGFAFHDLWRVLAKPDLVRLFFAQVATTLGPGWMSAIYLFFFRDSRGFTTQQATVLLGVYILAQLPGAFLTAALARRIGKHRTLMVATTGFSLGLMTIFLVPKGNLIASIPTMMWSGAMASGFDLMIRAMLADLGDEVRLTQGQDRLSLIYAVNTLAGKIAAALSIGLTFPLLALLGFNPADGAVNTHAAIRNLETAFLVGPIVFVMLGGACLIGWRLNAQRHEDVRRRLDELDLPTSLH